MAATSATSALSPVFGLEGNQDEIPCILTRGEYKFYPMEFCAEEQVATLFSKICQRGNPVLLGRPVADLVLLGRAMYRKAKILRTGLVAMLGDEPIAIGFSWDHADGGVWKDSGLERPASLEAHAACGGAAFESLPKRSETFFGGFYGSLPGHKTEIFGILAVSNFVLGKALGFGDTFQFTLLPSLNARGGVFGAFGKEEDNYNWNVKFADVAVGKEGPVADELRELDGNMTLSRTSNNFVLTDDYMEKAAQTVRLPTAQSMREPTELMAANHLNWLKKQPQQQPRKTIPSRL